MRRRVVRAVGAAALTTVTVSCSFGMPRGASEQGRDIFHLWQVFMIAGIAVAAIVYGLIGWSVFRYRRRSADGQDALGRQFRANVPLEVVYTAIPIALVIVLFALSYRTDDRVGALDPDPDVTLHAEAYTWGWRFTYSEPDGARALVSEPSGPGVAGPEIWLPRGQTVRIVLTSNDVIHAFWVPDFLFKRDAIPGRTTEFDVTPTEVGTYQGACAEFCGLNHAFMTFTVRVVELDGFMRWGCDEGLFACVKT